uniref:hypothetical protein n=1 Tax=Acetomicrobium sp. S15 = DSM 107314 TaxID=2529858 RepID=UPI001E3D2B32
HAELVQLTPYEPSLDSAIHTCFSQILMLQVPGIPHRRVNVAYMKLVTIICECGWISEVPAVGPWFRKRMIIIFL